MNRIFVLGLLVIHGLLSSGCAEPTDSPPDDNPPAATDQGSDNRNDQNKGAPQGSDSKEQEGKSG